MELMQYDIFYFKFKANSNIEWIVNRVLPFKRPLIVEQRKLERSDEKQS